MRPATLFLIAGVLVVQLLHHRDPADAPAAVAAPHSATPWLLSPAPYQSAFRARLPAPVADRADPPRGIHEFYFTRAIYTSQRSWRGFQERWAIDYPKADRQFIIGLKRLTNIDAYDLENPVAFDDPELRRFPFLYALEVGYIALTEAEIKGLQDYIRAGGFLFIDDFWGSYEWMNFEHELRRVFPDYDLRELPMDHPAFSAFYRIDEILQVPARGRGIFGRPTWEQDGYIPRSYGLFDEEGRLAVVINWNTDLGDAWEWADDPYYPLRFSTYAYEMGINFIIYAMTH